MRGIHTGEQTGPRRRRNRAGVRIRKYSPPARQPLHIRRIEAQIVRVYISVIRHRTVNPAHIIDQKEYDIRPLAAVPAIRTGRHCRAHRAQQRRLSRVWFHKLRACGDMRSGGPRCRRRYSPRGRKARR